MAAAALLSACADFSRGDPSPAVDAAAREGGADGGAPTFAADVQPLLAARCAQCHAPGKEAATTAFVSSPETRRPTAAARGRWWIRPARRRAAW
jgi:hypothetical protein